ncbi:DUF2399 domain-containing protein [Streptomyces platensis]|uniref:DUF2399 domain-containing protein n=1 Tax=Streptomyces platensis TaxID=58346 RepID=UPI003C2B5666
MVCTSGALTAVDHVLLGLAHTCGIPMEYSGDIDTGGKTIAAAVLRRYEAPSREMDDDTRRATWGAGVLYEGPPPAPALPGPACASSAANGTPNSAGTDNSGPAIFQEHPVVLDRLLDPDPVDPLSLPGPQPSDWHSSAPTRPSVQDGALTDPLP